jgi:4-hydroxybenzoate polyprenyltransferase
MNNAKAPWRRAREFLDMIKFEHTIFALPFAYLGMVLAAVGIPTAHDFIWITVAMASARTVGMAANRLADRMFDAENPRTASRPLVTGRVQPRTAWIGLVTAAFALLLAAYQLGPLPLRLLPGAMIFLVGYPFTKRFTLASHLVLGLTDGLAPMGAWAAVRGSLFASADLPAWILLGIVTLWIGGFDLIYACQDIEFDRTHHLHAVPARFGSRFALRLSGLFHALTTALIVFLGWMLPLGWPYWIGAAIAGTLLAYEHAIVLPHDLSRLDLAFFNINGMMSLTFFITTAASLFVPPMI